MCLHPDTRASIFILKKEEATYQDSEHTDLVCVFRLWMPFQQSDVSEVRGTVAGRRAINGPEQAGTRGTAQTNRPTGPIRA